MFIEVCIIVIGFIGDLYVWKFMLNYGVFVVWNVVLNEIICYFFYGK